MKTGMKRLITAEKGSLMILALLLLAVGALITAPLLSYMVGGLRAGRVFESKTAELYAADAGVEDAIWRIQNGIVRAPRCPGDPKRWSYNITAVNGRSVAVNITFVSNVAGRPIYGINSTATTDANSRTTIQSYVSPTIDFPAGYTLHAHGLTVTNETEIPGNVAVFGNVTLTGDAAIDGNVRATGDVILTGNASIWGNVIVFGNVILTGNASIDGSVIVFGNVTLNGTAEIDAQGGFVCAWGSVTLRDYAEITRGRVQAGGNVTLTHRAKIYLNVHVRPEATVSVSPTARIAGRIYRDFGGCPLPISVRILTWRIN